MKPEEVGYLRLRMAGAEETMEEARLLLDNGHLRGAVNRLYYACFYMVTALLFTAQLHSAKHSGVRSLFVRHWIRTGRLPVETGDFYQRLFERRHKGDYHDLAVFEREDVEGWFEEARAFMDQLSGEIENHIATGGSNEDSC